VVCESLSTSGWLCRGVEGKWNDLVDRAGFGHLDQIEQKLYPKLLQRRLPTCPRIARHNLLIKHHLFLAAETFGSFTQELILLLPARLKRPGEDLLEMVAVVHDGVKKNYVCSFFGSG
jgi:hypothetical protein